MKKRESLLLAGVLVLCGAITVYLYGRTLHYGFFLDDAPDLWRAADYPIGRILASGADSGYYRPFLLLFWRGLHALLGGYNPVVLHGLNLAVDAANGMLIYLLCARLDRRPTGIAAAVLFLLYPFHFQNVPVINSAFHSVVTLFSLLTVLLYVQYRRTGSRVSLGLSLLTTALAMLTHESAVMLPLLLVLVDLILKTGKGRRRLERFPLAHGGLITALLALWLIVPKWPHDSWLSLPSLGMNALYFLQGLTFPVSRYLHASWPSWLLAMSLVEVLVVMLALGIHLDRRLARVRMFLLGLGWFVLMSLPAGLGLPWSYVIDGPRLLYLPSVGISLALGSILAWPFEVDARWSRWWLEAGVVSVLALLFIVWQSTDFIAKRDEMYASATALDKALARVVPASCAARPLFVNVPSWFAPKPKDETYPLGHSGFATIPSYVGIGSHLALWRPEIVGAQSVAFSEKAGDYRFWYGLHGRSTGVDETATAVRNATCAYGVIYDGSTLELEGGRVEESSPPPTPPHAALATFADWAELGNDAELTVSRGFVVARLTWRALALAPGDYTVFAQLFDESGKMVAQKDGYPIAQLYPPRAWRTGELISEERLLIRASALPPGRYHLLVGLYDRASGKRAPALDGSGARFSDDAVPVGSIVLPAP